MLAIPCPWCGVRSENEFRYAGPAENKRPVNPAAISDGAWASFLYMRDNPKGDNTELWRHTHGCGRFFVCVRHTASDRIVTSYRPGEEQQS
jgi:sarcosine oxidase, subunit delta